MAALGDCGLWEKHDARKEREDIDALKASEWPGFILLKSTRSTVHVVGAGITVNSSTAERPWSSHLFYNNRFLPLVCIEKRSLHEQKRIFVVVVSYKVMNFSS